MQPNSTWEPYWTIRYDPRWGIYTYWLLQHLQHVKFQAEGGFIYRLQITIAWIFVCEQSWYPLFSQASFYNKHKSLYSWRTYVFHFHDSQ